MPDHAVFILLTALASSWGLARLVVATTAWHGRLSVDSHYGVQKIHDGATPRIGGVAVAGGLLAAWAASAWAGAAASAVLACMVLAGVPALGAGLTEDCTKQVSVRARLLATLASGAGAWWFSGVAMQNTGLPPLDALLQWTPLAVLFTAFAVGGVANAINIIDGLNGLASGSVTIMALGLAGLAWQLGDPTLTHAALVVAAVALGFFVVNWPRGVVFLGDGGAYLLGFALAWLAVLIPMRHPDTSAWSTLLVLAYPVLEVAVSVHRRRNRQGHHPGRPDRVHLHHLVLRRVVCLRLPQWPKRLKNGAAGALCLVAPFTTSVLANVAPRSAGWAAAALAAAGLLYVLVYRRLSGIRGTPPAVATVVASKSALGVEGRRVV